MRFMESSTVRRARIMVFKIYEVHTPKGVFSDYKE